MLKLEERPQYCGECKYIQSKEYLVDLWFDGNEHCYCIQARLNVYREDKACPWGLKEDKPKE